MFTISFALKKAMDRDIANNLIDVPHIATYPNIIVKPPMLNTS